MKGVSEYSLETLVERSFLLISSRQRFVFCKSWEGGGGLRKELGGYFLKYFVEGFLNTTASRRVE